MRSHVNSGLVLRFSRESGRRVRRRFKSIMEGKSEYAVFLMHTKHSPGIAMESVLHAKLLLLK